LIIFAFFRRCLIVRCYAMPLSVCHELFSLYFRRQLFAIIFATPPLFQPLTLRYSSD
jgi:hypothetical protein